MLEVVGDVVEGEPHLSIGAADVDRSLIATGDLAEIAIENPEVVSVLAAQDPVADTEALLVDHGHERAQASVGFKRRVGPGVQITDVTAPDGPHDDVPAGGSVGPPVQDHLVAESVAIAIISLARDWPELYERSRREQYGPKSEVDPPTAVIQYLLHKKTEKTLTVATSSGDEDVLTYWWDDYFSTAEVVEALARFYEYSNSDPDRTMQYGWMLHGVKEALVRACTYFEQGQVEGMWGSHIDTLRVIYAYVLIRRLIPQRESGLDDPLIVPEVHTTFKALRWMCDEKQIFEDGSFMHTMFLTTFYSLALIEVYRSWDSCQKRIEEIYDDVVWASPVRTTPERSKRLAAELLNSQLMQDFNTEREHRRRFEEALHDSKRSQFKITLTLLAAFVTIPAILLVGNLAELSEARFRMIEPAGFLQLVAVVVTVAIAVITFAWQYDKVRHVSERSTDVARPTVEGDRPASATD